MEKRILIEVLKSEQNEIEIEEKNEIQDDIRKSNKQIKAKKDLLRLEKTYFDNIYNE